MTLMEDNRKKKDWDDAELLSEPGEDKEALEMDGKNPLAEEESVEEDDSGSD